MKQIELSFKNALGATTLSDIQGLKPEAHNSLL